MHAAVEILGGDRLVRAKDVNVVHNRAVHIFRWRSLVGVTLGAIWCKSRVRESV